MAHFQIQSLRALVFGFLLSPLTAQWISYPTAGVPRTPDGKPDLGAACPRTADGRPDLSGLWMMQPNRDATPNFPGCEPTAEEFTNIGRSLKDGLPYQPWAADLVTKRRAEPAPARSALVLSAHRTSPIAYLVDAQEGDPDSRKLDTDLLDFICSENEKDTHHLLVK